MPTSTIQYVQIDQGTLQFLGAMIGFEFLAICFISIICMSLVYFKR